MFLSYHGANKEHPEQLRQMWHPNFRIHWLGLK
ncbi:hypothetical protein FOQG_15301 [Fusarium oxysporum f. sp. raphani 54005]|uniref:Uncharacterized protein n=2 Tax=Fusarium oxysporum TaxID=5507 RepID=X0BP08_FUSOX|nr:hypothetical protein FOVG_14751 [Fusarium oxysporum f. sp. pisi HDV247]EXK80169.1 hypothetical protein FOQG_15301 [Fusarium oxysporum f. sp. raphani 54005]